MTRSGVLPERIGGVSPPAASSHAQTYRILKKYVKFISLRLSSVILTAISVIKGVVSPDFRGRQTT